MSDIAGLLKSEITRLSKKAIRTYVAPIRATTSAHRRDIAALKRQVAALEREVTKLRKGFAQTSERSEPEPGRRPRFVAKGLKSLRNKLGLSAEQFGMLVGVSAQTIYNWEARKATPRAAQLESLQSVRSIGKREARARLEALNSTPTESE